MEKCTLAKKVFCPLNIGNVDLNSALRYLVGDPSRIYKCGTD
ncbi:hypothetical protein P4V63_23315 [Bacillus toyonensis]|nr:hypothetical protein [Bacillus toyonensis]MEE2020850.1 hypothetical protein [Bacillus toyonensis]